MTATREELTNAILIAAAAGFLLGIFTAVGVWKVAQVDSDSSNVIAPAPEARASEVHPIVVEGHRSDVARPASAPITAERIGPDPVSELRGRGLALPITSVRPDALHDSFDERRGSNRRHEAIDILAPRNTPVVAVEDGSIARLFLSKAGGITVYQFDPSKEYVYYYAHLERYADDLTEHEPVRRGQLIGYVGTSGNAAEDTPHLHFAIFRMTDAKEWWDGTPIDPFDVFR
jgi:murein DD-endopeptidase MepM/ murein hydrolase activator NlpD